MLYNDCVHTKLTHDRWTGPWTVTAVITPGLCYRVTLQGKRERVRRAAASHVKPYYRRPPSLRHDFGDEYAHFAWGPDLELVADSTLASPLYTLVDRCTIQLPNGPWEWRYRGRYLNGSLSTKHLSSPVINESRHPPRLVKEEGDMILNDADIPDSIARALFDALKENRTGNHLPAMRISGGSRRRLVNTAVIWRRRGNQVQSP